MHRIVQGPHEKRIEQRTLLRPEGEETTVEYLLLERGEFVAASYRFDHPR